MPSQTIESTGITVDKFRQVHLADAKANYVSPELDTEAEVIVAVNATNAKINAVLLALESTGIIAPV